MAAWLSLLAIGIPFNGLLNFDATQFMLDVFGQSPLEVWMCRSDEVTTEIKKERGLDRTPNKQNQERAGSSEKR